MALLAGKLYKNKISPVTVSVLGY